MASQPPKQEIIDKIKDATNILVAVSADPSVDELSAALGLTLFLNKLDKHATAVFSGKVPPAISFLEPDKTFEGTVDSLRDFIIALDKEKADHLRYKVVDDAVKIFITPYRTTISEKDLDFSQGDYNVELVIALNVENSEHLDAALAAHGKILHDAVVTTVTAGAVKSSLGTIDWHDEKASSVSEMLVELIDGLKTPKVVLDEQISTALLTGVVAATERFSNTLTSSRTMTAAAELMAAGANQQLIAQKLLEGEAKPADDMPRPSDGNDDGGGSSDDASSVSDSAASDDAPEEKDETKLSIQREAKTKPESKKTDGALSVRHEKTGSLEEVAKQAQAEAQDAATRAATAQLSKIQPLGSITGDADLSYEEQPVIQPSTAAMPQTAPSPVFGGTLNATSDQAAEDKRRERESDQNKAILTHRQYVGDDTPSFSDSPLNATIAGSDEPPKVDPFAAAPSAGKSGDDVLSALKEETKKIAEPAASGASSTPAAPMTTLADIEANISHGLPPMPDFSQLPPLPPAPVGAAVGEGSTATPSPTSATQPNGQFNPSQFQIPGQS